MFTVKSFVQVENTKLNKNKMKIVSVIIFIVKVALGKNDSMKVVSNFSTLTVLF